MTNRFATGSGDTSRRRRRLATAGEGGDQVSQISAETPVVDPQRRRILNLHSPSRHPIAPPALDLTRLVPRHPLWYGLLAGLLLGGVAGLHWAAERTEIWRTEISPGLARLVDPRLGVLGGAATAILCLGASQLLWVVGWIRSHSDRDYSGRYRRWFRWALQIGFLGLISAVHGYRSLGQAAPQMLPETLTNRDVLAWLIPLVAWQAWGTGASTLELRKAPAPMIFLGLSGLTCLLAGGLSLRLIDVGPDPERLCWQQTLFLADAVGVFLAASLALRHVLYVSLDPPVSGTTPEAIPKPHISLTESGPTLPRGSGRTRRRVIGKKRSKTRRSRRSTPRVSPGDDDVESSTEEEDWMENDSTTSGESVEEDLPDSSLDSVSPEEEPEPEEWSTLNSSAGIRTNSGPRSSESRSPATVSSPAESGDLEGESDDEETDEGEGGGQSDNLKGLSKRERRRLRQQQKDRDRQSGRR